MTAETESQIEEFRRATQRMDGSRYTDRLVVLVHQAKKILAGFDAERLKRQQAEHERDSLVEDLAGLRDAIEAHRNSVCDNPKQNGSTADKLLWLLIESADDVESPIGCAVCGEPTLQGRKYCCEICESDATPR